MVFTVSFSSIAKEVDTLLEESYGKKIQRHLEFSNSEEVIMSKSLELCEKIKLCYLKQNTFDNEQDHWEFQFEMFRKDLPIQKYIAAKEQTYIDKCVFKNNSKNAVTGERETIAVFEYQDEWDKQFSNMKENVVKKYDFSVE